MSVERHLVLQELSLQPSAEWSPQFEGWLVARVIDGSGYSIKPSASARLLGAGDGFIASKKADAVFRASQLGVLKLQFFIIQPQHLNGLLTVVESHQLEMPKEGAPQILFFNASEPISAKFSRIVEQFQNNKFAMRCALLQLWAGAVSGILQTTSLEVENDSKLRARFRQLVGQMTEAELSQHSLSDLAQQLHCSERHFSRLFREEFKTPFRAHQIELRLQRARQLLATSDSKVINVAYDSGYRHLGLFNSMFKKRFGLTPSEWRQQSRRSKKNPPALNKRSLAKVAIRVTATLLLLLHLNVFGVTDSADDAAKMREVANAIAKLKMADDERWRTNPPPMLYTNAVKPKPKPKLQVERYYVYGNTVLSPQMIGDAFTNVPGAFGKEVTFDDIRASLTDLQMAYRERGFVTVSVGLPQQRLTNATVKVQVTEGNLAAINVIGNHYFSSNNVMRALPGLHTNMLLNSQVFQRELDTANTSRDRQIYPVIGPGPEPGTSELTLKVKDQLPLHGRFEVNDQGAPDTPAWRANLTAQYDNLWDLEHQIGVQYSCAFEQYRGADYFARTPFDEPLIANYSAYYRMPLGPAQDVQQQIDTSSGAFGYNEITHQFVLPPATGKPEFTFFASRSVSDTGIQDGQVKTVVSSPLVTIDSMDSGDNFTANENIGGRLTIPLPPADVLNSSFFVGINYKHYRQYSFNTNNFFVGEVITNSDGSVTQLREGIHTGQTPRMTTVDYVPLNFGFSGTLKDDWGVTAFNATANLNFGSLSDDLVFEMASTNREARNRYVTLQLSADRDQKICGDWTVRLHADGQWADGPLFSNEQYAMGGANSVRGYLDGEAYGDSGWRVSVEPRTPLFKLGYVDGDVPFWWRGFIFVDYGQLYHQGNVPGITFRSQEFLGAGFGMNVNIGQHFDARMTIAWPIADDHARNAFNQPYSPVGVPHVYVGAGLQF